MIFTKSLKGSYEFKKILKQGKYQNQENITVYNIKNNRQTNYLGVCVSKKHGNSVVRNKLKRWAKESYKEYEENIQKGNNIIILFRKNIEVKDLNFWKIKEEIRNALKGLGIYNEVF